MKETCCPRCHATVVCGANTIEDCFCTTIPVTEATRHLLSKYKNNTCLCARCLQELNDLTDKAAALVFPTQAHELVEGVHYNIENGFWVFTELYHYLRGECCGNGCKNCAYGFKK